MIFLKRSERYSIIVWQNENKIKERKKEKREHIV